MNRRRMLLGCTALVGCLYAAVFTWVFSYEKKEEQVQVLLQNEESTVSEALYWLQAGVFKEQSSYESLKNQLENADFSVYCIPKNELTVVVFGVTSSKTQLENFEAKANELSIESIRKETQLTDVQRTLVDNGEIEKVLKEVIGQ